jgi:TP901 family phage tail tape measure protein
MSGTLAGTAYVRVAYDPASIQSMRRTVAAEGQKAGSSFASSFAKSGPALTRVGHTLTRNLTLPIGLAAAAATKYTYDFSQSLNHISALVGVGSKQMDQYRTAILKLSPAVGQGPTQLADALYFITSSGYKGAAALDVLRASAKGAASGLGDTKTIADLVTSAVTVYGQKNLSASHAVDVLTQAVRDGKGEPDQYATALGRLIPIANAMGVSFDQTSAAVASLTLAGFSVDKAVTGMQSVFTNLSKPTTTGAAALQKVGLSYAGIRKEIQDKGLLPALVSMNKAFDGNQVALRQVFSSGKAIVPFLALTGQAAGRTSKVFDDLAHSTGASNKAFATQSKTTAFQVQKAMAQIQTASVSLGSVLLPIFAKVIGVVADAAQAFSKLPSGMQEVAVGAATMAFALGPVLTVIGNVAKATGFLTSAFTSAAPALTATAPAAKSAATGISGFSAAATEASGGAGLLSASILGPVGIVAAGVAAVGIFIKVTHGLAGQSHAMSDATATAQTYAQALQGIAPATLSLKEATAGHVAAIKAYHTAQTTVNQGVKNGLKGTKQYRSDLIAQQQAQFNVTGTLLQQQTAQSQLNDAQTKSRTASKLAAAGLEELSRDAQKAARQQENLNNRFGGFTQQAGGAATKIRLLADQANAFSGKTLKLAQSQEVAAKKLGGTGTAAGLAQTKVSAMSLAASQLTDRLGKVPTVKQILIYYKHNLSSLINQALQLGAAIDHLQSKQLSITTSYRTYHQNSGPAAGNAAGTDFWRGGPTWVGEKGPEILNVPRGAQIVPHDKAMAMAGVGGDTYVFIGNEAVDSHLVRVVRGTNQQTARRVKAGRSVA